MADSEQFGEGRFPLAHGLRRYSLWWPEAWWQMGPWQEEHAVACSHLGRHREAETRVGL